MDRLNLALSQLGNWQLIYAKQLLGRENPVMRGIPLIDVQEVPVLIEERILAVSATYLLAKPTWNTAGWLYQEVDVPLDDGFTFEGIGGANTTLDVAKERIGLNGNQLVIFDRVANQHRYRFEAVPWMPKLSLAMWAYIGPESDPTDELVQSLKLDVLRLETKIDAL
jgi:hypothetical protein